MASRYPYSNIYARDPQSSSSLFDNYPGGDARSRPGSTPTTTNSTYAYHGNKDDSPYLHSEVQAGGNAFRPATQNSKGQYSQSVLESLESQNENESTSMLSAKVGQLKQLTLAIGEEIRESSALADKMNDSFDNTRVKLRGTIRRMLRMSEKTGVGWKIWLGFFVAVWCLFVWVWLF